MKFYVDFQTKQVTKIDPEALFYQSNNLTNTISIYLANCEIDYFLSLEFLRADNRKYSLHTATDISSEEVDGVTYAVHTFVLTDLILAVAGTLGFTSYMNYTNVDSSTTPATVTLTGRGALFNGVNKVVKTAGFTADSLLVLDSGQTPEEIEQSILNDILSLNGLVNNALAGVATNAANIAANAFTVAADSGLTLSNHNLAAKLKTGGGLVKNSNGVYINYDPNRFMIDDNVKLNLHANYNVIPVNQSIIGQVGTPYQVTKTESTVGYTTTKTFTFNSALITQIKKNVQVRGYQGDYSNLAPVSTYANFAPRYALSFDLSDATLNELFTDIVRSVDASYYAGAEKVIFYPVGYYTNTDTYYYFAADYWHSKSFRIILMIKQESGSNTGFVRTWYESIENRYELDYIKVCELSQIKTNKTNIASLQSEVNAIKDGTTLDSFADVEGAIDDVEDDVSALQTQVNNLSSVQNVVDIVATKSALDALTTTNFEEDDKVQVIADETHGGASTVYNWTGSVWEYVGAYGGNSYTKAQTDTLLDGKADKSTTYTKTEIDTILNTVLIEKSFESLAVDQMTITGYVTQEVLNSIGPRTQVKLRVYDSTNDITFILNPNFTPETNVYNFKCTVNSPIDADGMIEVEGGISIDREYSFVIRNIKIYTEAEVNTLLASKQDTLSGSSSIDVTSNVVSVKDSYVESFFATSQEIDNMLEEVFG